MAPFPGCGLPSRAWLVLLLASFYPGQTRAAPPTLAPALPTPPEPAPNVPLGAQLLLERGRAAQQRGQAAQALRYYSEAVKLAPTFEPPYLQLAQLRLNMGHFDQAREVLELALTRARPAANARAELARLDYAAGNHNHALALLRQACEATERVDLWQRLARWYLQERNHPAALSVWRRLAHHPQMPPDAGVSVAALRWLSGELDPVVAGAEDGDWVRRSLAKLDRQRPLP